MKNEPQVFTNGCFDILHRGHFELLRYCSSLGKVTVGINSDASIRRLKGLNRPVNSEEDRAFALQACRFVNEVIIFSEDTPERLITELRPDFIVKGGDYKKDEVIGREVAEVLIFDFIPGYSSSSIIEELNMKNPGLE